jgi:hypothetical protein
MLPEVLKFPGMSLERSLDFFVEEYGTIDTTRQVIYVEVHRRGTPWLFQLEETLSMFDSGCVDSTLHRRLYQDRLDAPIFAQWFKH